MEAGAPPVPGRSIAERMRSGVDRIRRAPLWVGAGLGLAVLIALIMVGEYGIDGLVFGGLTPLEAILLVGSFAATLALLQRTRERVPLAALIVVLEIVVVLVITNDIQRVSQTALNGLAFGSVIALGAVGLTLVYGILKLVNFAHGDFLTFGAYIGLLVSVTWDMPFVLAVLAAIVATALLSIFFEITMWGPIRNRGGGLLQLLLMAIGLALVIRNAIQFVAGTQVRVLDVNRTDTVSFVDLTIGRTQLIVLVTGVAVLVGIGLLLRYTLLGKRMRALADNLDLAETSGINTKRIIIYTWVFSGALAGLAGVLFTATTVVKPEAGFELLLPIFAAVVLGGIGDAFGALAAGLLLGVVIEWSTLVIDARWKLALGFVVLILVLMIRPQGIFGKARTI